MNPPDNMQIDHKNDNGLDNRKLNLRVCTSGQNAQNRPSQKGASSKFKGVSWSKKKKKWRSVLHQNDKSIHIGYYDNEIEAACAYDKAAKELFGEFAYLNNARSAVKEKE